MVGVEVKLQRPDSQEDPDVIANPVPWSLVRGRAVLEQRIVDSQCMDQVEYQVDATTLLVCNGLQELLSDNRSRAFGSCGRVGDSEKVGHLGQSKAVDVFVFRRGVRLELVQHDPTLAEMHDGAKEGTVVECHGHDELPETTSVSFEPVQRMGWDAWGLCPCRRVLPE